MPFFIFPPNIQKLRDKRDVNNLIAALTYKKQSNQREHYRIREEAAKALGEIGDVSAIPHLVNALQDREAHVRETVANTLDKLGWIADSENTQLAYLAAKASRLINKLTSPSHLCRDSMKKLEEIGPVIIKPLLTSLESKPIHDTDSYKNKVGNIVTILITIGTKEAVNAAIQILSTNNLETWIVELAFKNLPQASISYLIPHLRNRNPVVRSTVLKNLEKSDDIEFVDSLVDMLESERHEEDRKMAFEALGRIGRDEAIVEVLTNIVKMGDSSRKEESVKLLAKMCDARAFESLFSALDESSKEIRIPAYKALIELDSKGKLNEDQVRRLTIKIQQIFVPVEQIPDSIYEIYLKNRHILEPKIEPYWYFCDIKVYGEADLKRVIEHDKRFAIHQRVDPEPWSFFVLGLGYHHRDPRIEIIYKKISDFLLDQGYSCYNEYRDD